MSTGASMPLANLMETRRTYGTTAALRWLSSRLSEKLLRLEVSELLWLDVLSLSPHTELGPEFSFRFLSPDEITCFASDPQYCLAPDFVQRAFDRHDRCLAALHGDQLASYSWYACNSIGGQDHVGVSMSYPAELAYMYNAFTHPAYRGRRLFGIGVKIAAKELAAKGVTKLITTVNSSNFASLQSCRRMGFNSLGQIWAFGHGPKRFAKTPHAARQMGINFAR
jgi:hypothetical protein